ncbi:MAG: hypothetical protein F4118_13045, partial [Acidimicrobiaceae bacterium]|nr:hypothetical protein [Acidimicrobiaceae bacterium]
MFKTVQELIEELSKHPPETPVVLERCEYGSHEGYDHPSEVKTLLIRKSDTHEGEFEEIMDWESDKSDGKTAVT